MCLPLVVDVDFFKKKIVSFGDDMVTLLTDHFQSSFENDGSVKAEFPLLRTSVFEQKFCISNRFSVQCHVFGDQKTSVRHYYDYTQMCCM